MLEDVLQNRQHILICIQYEVLQKKSNEEAYLSFCNILGKSVMEYHEFDFWYYHFVNGNFDLNHNRNKDPKQRGLSNMPLDIAKKIVEKLKPIEKCIFRNVSQKCREIVDKNPFIIKRIDLTDFGCGTSVSFDNHSFKYGVNKFKEVVSIENQEEDTEYDEVDQARIKLEGDKKEECEKRVVQTLAIALNNPRLQIGNLSFSIKEQTLVDKLGFLFKSLNHKLHVEAFIFSDRQNQKQDDLQGVNFMKFLPHLKPGVLEKIELYSSPRVNMDFDSTLKKLAELELWKQATQFETNLGIFDNIDKVAHFDRLIVFLTSYLKPEDVVYLKNVYLNSPTFDVCKLGGYYMDEERIREELGGDRFPMANGSTLHVDVSRWEVHFYKR